MISNFDDFLKAKFQDHLALNFCADDLDEGERKDLQELVKSWDVSKIEEANDALDAFGVSLPNEFIREVLIEHLDIAAEVWAGGINDTCQRELFIDIICHKLGVGSWPVYSTPKAVSDKFYEEFRKKVYAVGGTFDGGG